MFETLSLAKKSISDGKTSSLGEVKQIWWKYEVLTKIAEKLKANLGHKKRLVYFSHSG